MEELTKKQRKQLKKLEKRESQTISKRKMKVKRFSKAVGILVILAGVVVVIGKSMGPLPGEKFVDQGREHVIDISEIVFNSTPPTSGSHFAIWARPGVYENVLSDGYLIHSLEHGYVNIGYNCSMGESNVVEEASNSATSKLALKRLNFTPGAGMSAFGPESQPEKEVDLPSAFESTECKSLVAGLVEASKDFERVVISPRTDIDYPISLTAWTYLLNLDSLDEEKIKGFLTAHHNHGPEKTVE